ncbi:cupin domain-containing protein [Nocardiopsis dassonvillei]
MRARLTMIFTAPIHTPATGGATYDFGTHANDFLVRREQAGATEVFTVRVPGGGAVPEHVHTDMEQTFVFLSGVGTATLTHGTRRARYTCRPGDTLFVPTGWQHTLVADSLSGVTYVCVNAFLPDRERVGDTAVEHADLVAPHFPPLSTRSSREEELRVALARAAETGFTTTPERMVPADFTAFDATLLSDPSTYRVRQVGPFLYPTRVAPAPRVVGVREADLLHTASAATGLRVFVEGSQSPLSVKPPCAASDVDVLVAVQSAEELDSARLFAPVLVQALRHLDAEVSVGVIHIGWLGLPGFYSAISTDPADPDRTWWEADQKSRLAEAEHRMRNALDRVTDPVWCRRLLEQSQTLLECTEQALGEFQISPRWKGYL